MSFVGQLLQPIATWGGDLDISRARIYSRWIWESVFHLHRIRKTHGAEGKGGRKCGNTKKGGSKRVVCTERK